MIFVAACQHRWDCGWKKPARELADMIFPKATAAFWDKTDEIIFVPDGLGWYLPLEILQLRSSTPDETVSLHTQADVRYAPTMGLAIPDQRVLPRFPRFGLIANTNYSRDSVEMIAQASQQLQNENQRGHCRITLT